MNKLIILILAGTLGMACGKTHDPAPEPSCWVFVTTTENPVLLLAKSRLRNKEAFVIFDDFKTTYGKNNVILDGRSPFYDGWNGEHIPFNPEMTPDCYEITMVIDYSDTSIPSNENLFIGHGFRAVMATSDFTVICKRYDWAETEEDANGLILWCEDSFNILKKHLGGGTIISTAIKNLGPEVHNMPIIF